MTNSLNSTHSSWNNYANNPFDSNSFNWNKLSNNSNWFISISANVPYINLKTEGDNIFVKINNNLSKSIIIPNNILVTCSESKLFIASSNQSTLFSFLHQVYISCFYQINLKNHIYLTSGL